MVTHHPAKFSGHWHCGNGYMLLMVGQQYSTHLKHNSGSLKDIP